jgi:glycosyltransferase involved in cell wall biosynthesis
MYLPWTILHIDLEVSLPALPKQENRQGYFIVFWYRRIPVGHFTIAASALPLTPAQVAEVASTLEVLQPIAPASPPEAHVSLLTNRETVLRQRLAVRVSPSGEPASELPTLSVIVPTRGRPASLRRCLCSLAMLAWAPTEIIVVDNAPRVGATFEAVAQLPGARYVPEPRPGLDIARNTGIRHSTGDIIAFTDDDVTVHSDWSWRLLEAFRAPEIMAATGLVLPATLDTEAQWLFETLWSFNRGYQPKTFDARFFEKTRALGAPVWEIGAGANMAFRREVFAQVGLFDERLDAGAAGCSGDSELWYRILATGGTCRYEPSAVVYHAHRREMADLRNQLHFYMRGHVVALLIQFERFRHWGNLRRLFFSLPKYYLKLFGRSLVGSPSHRLHSLTAEISGCLSGMLFYLRNRQYDEPGA